MICVTGDLCSISELEGIGTAHYGFASFLVKQEIASLMTARSTFKQLTEFILVRQTRQKRPQYLNPSPCTGPTTRVNLHIDATDRHAPRINLHKAPPSLRRKLHATLNHNLFPSVVVNLRPSLDKLCRPNLHMLGHANGEVIIRPGFTLAVEVGDAVLFNPELTENIRLNGVMPFIADPNLLVMLNVFIPVALGVQINLFRTFLVFNPKLVVALAARRAERLERTAGLVRRQVVG